jgi:uncharacterized protein with von Willebrand factor type A (vWA) domain
MPMRGGVQCKGLWNLFPSAGTTTKRVEQTEDSHGRTTKWVNADGKVWLTQIESPDGTHTSIGPRGTEVMIPNPREPYFVTIKSDLEKNPKVVSPPNLMTEVPIVLAVTHMMIVGSKRLRIMMVL